MELTVDKLGRLVIPKEVRDRWNLVPGSVVDLEETAQGLTLHPAGRWTITVRDGLPVLTGGHVPADFAWDRLVQDERDERLDALVGTPWPAP